MLAVLGLWLTHSSQTRIEKTKRKEAFAEEEDPLTGEAILGTESSASLSLSFDRLNKTVSEGKYGEKAHLILSRQTRIRYISVQHSM